MLVVADVAVGPAIAIFGIVGGSIFYLLVTLIEGIALRLLSWASFGRSLRDAAIVNLASTVAGFLLWIVIVGQLPGEFARFPALLLVLAWIFSVLIEGWLLGRLERYAPRRTWSAAIIVNTVSYLILSGLLFSGGSL